MYYHLMSSTDIRTNLATEEYLLNQLTFDEPLVLFYLQEPSVILGKHQTLNDEINLAYAQEQKITITRRLSGGGAVYDDLGNLSFSFVTQASSQHFGDFNFFVKPILNALRSLGITDAEMSGRNDLLIAGKKFSGNAMYKRGNKLFCHGTLMLDVDLAVIPQVLKASPSKLKKNGVASVRSRVTNLRPYLSPAFETITTEKFRDQLLLALFNVSDVSQIRHREYQLSGADQQAIDELVKTRYANPEWVYGQAPDYDFKRHKTFASGTITVALTLEQEVISSISFAGDYFSQVDSAVLEQHLLNLPYQRTVLADVLSNLPIDDYFSQITAVELLDLLID